MCLVWMGSMGWLQSWLYRWYEFLLGTEIKKYFKDIKFADALIMKTMEHHATEMELTLQNARIIQMLVRAVSIIMKIVRKFQLATALICVSKMTWSFYARNIAENALIGEDGILLELEWLSNPFLLAISTNFCIYFSCFFNKIIMHEPINQSHFLIYRLNILSTCKNISGIKVCFVAFVD